MRNMNWVCYIRPDSILRRPKEQSISCSIIAPEPEVMLGGSKRGPFDHVRAPSPLFPYTPHYVVAEFHLRLTKPGQLDSDKLGD